MRVPEDVPDYRSVVFKVADDEHRVEVGIALLKRGVEHLESDNKRLAQPLIDIGRGIVDDYSEETSNSLHFAEPSKD